MKLEDDDGQTYEMVSHRPLETGRATIYAEAFPECQGCELRAIVGRSAAGQVVEFMAVGKSDGAGADLELTLVTGNCAITFETLPPASFVEYCFGEEPERFYLAQVSMEALETWRGMKFKFWMDMLEKPSCEAQFRRMLQIGVITQLYDAKLFPTPDAHKPLYHVVDPSGKTIELPHPVAQLRRWDASEQRYVAVDPHLDGAPSEAEKEAWWASCLQKLRETHGAEYIASLMGE